MGALILIQTLRPATFSCDRQVCDSVRTSAGGRQARFLRGRSTSSAPLRAGEATSEITARDDDEEPKLHPLLRGLRGGSAWSCSAFSVHMQLIDHRLGTNRSKVARSATVPKAEGRGSMDDDTATGSEDGQVEYSEYLWPLYCDVLPRSLACEILRVASRIMSDEVESKALKVQMKSKKPQRLSTTSWDLLE